MEARKPYTYNPAPELRLSGWKIVSEKEASSELECRFECEGGNFILLWDHRNSWEPFPEFISVNGVPATSCDDYYVRPNGSRYGLPVRFRKGENIIRAEARLEGKKADALKMTLIPALPPVSAPAQYSKAYPAGKAEIWPEIPPIAHDGFTPGAGRERIPGRFASQKGDGLLDCAMTKLGVIDRMYLCSHPKYKKPFRWIYSTRPEQELFGEEKINVRNHLCVTWTQGTFSCTYSLASAGIITESGTADSCLSKLEFASSCQYVLTSNRVCSLNEFDPASMQENWVLLFGSTEYPDIPLLAVFDRKPKSIDVERLENGRLSSIRFRGAPLMITATPFGMESFDPICPDDMKFLKDAAGRCRFWSRAVLAYPVSCREYFLNDHEAETVSIVQEYDYRMIHDEFGTEPLKTAPLPPPLGIIAPLAKSETVDFLFPTKYGPLTGSIGSTSSYTLAMMPVGRKYPLRDVASNISEILRDGLQDFFDFAAKFSPDTQSYAYPGAVLEQYAYCSPVTNFMPPDKREKMALECAARLEKACDPNRRYTLCRMQWRQMFDIPRDKVYEFFHSPEMHTFEMWNVYERTEPFTGQKYNYCYFNVGLMWSNVFKTCSREEIAKTFHPGLVENDWGLGITFYMIYSAALTCGDFSSVIRHWDTLRKMFRYFDIFQDWACMGAGYAEKATTWVEGANYGAFTSYIKLAETAGDRAEYEYATCLAAKMLLLRAAVFLSGERYFYRYFDAEPWIGQAFFQEEYSPSVQHLHGHPVPAKKGHIAYDMGGLMTDAVYPELFDGFRKIIPDAFRKTSATYRDIYFNEFRNTINSYTALIVSDALDPEIPSEQTAAELGIAISKELFMTEWHDIHRFENYLPKNFMRCQILAWLEMRKHPLWLEHWEGIRILDAALDGRKVLIEIESTALQGKLCCGLRGKVPVEILFTGKKCRNLPASVNELKLETTGSGILTMIFDE